MRKLVVLAALLALLVALGTTVASATPGSSEDSCTSIQSGLLKDSHGNTLTVGYDQWGYNYQAHMFNGFYENYARPNPPVTQSDTWLEMKWSDDWLSNKDCDGDGLLDRGGTSGISKGWLTNHFRGTYVDSSGNVQHYTEFIKVVWVGPGGSLWGQYKIIQDVLNDPAGGFHGNQFKPVNPGLGINDHWTSGS
jgi:hypothetical protein